jgi:hypothetical protein
LAIFESAHCHRSHTLLDECSAVLEGLLHVGVGDAIINHHTRIRDPSRRVEHSRSHRHLPLREAVEIANAAGALAVTLNGASCSIPPLSDLTSPGTVQPAPVVTPAKEIK